MSGRMGRRALGWIAAVVAGGVLTGAAWAADPASATDVRIATAQQAVAAAPKKPAAYDQLGQAYFQKARETVDAAFYQLAETALQKALDLAAESDEPGAELAGSQAAVHMALVYMGEHRFREALTLADRSLAGGNATPEAFALMGDAYADLGEYDRAADAYESLGRLGALSRTPLQVAYVHDSRASYLAYIHGDSEQSIALMQQAVHAALQSRIPAENLAWLYYELGERYFSSGDVTHAGQAYAAGVAADEHHFRALAGLAKVRAAEGRWADAIELYQRSLAVVPMPQYLAELGDVYRVSGHSKEAQQQFDLVEYIARLNRINQVLNGRELAEFYADHDMKLAEAVKLAKEELALRQDVLTWDVLAWALYKNGQLEEAEQAMQHALSLRTANATFYFHAGMIHRAMGRKELAAQELQTALRINPAFHPVFRGEAERAARELAAENAGSAVAAKR